ncbi:sigma factor-like helix-turn-helix DNA-binding protein [Baekduia sp. Peel2402]|uniref:sigma factor-like helix-turn-helix DNA-binding protein n=1 Tax=Baekduia sp. Peel2402 TaxID=3458296 RepID=UPI00403EE679
MPSAHQDPAIAAARLAEMVEARTVEGLSHEKIAARFGVSRERVRQRLRYAAKVQRDAERRERAEEAAGAFGAPPAADEIPDLLPPSLVGDHPPTTLRLALAAGRASGRSFEEAWTAAAAVALSKLPPREADEWRGVFASTRDGWRSAYEDEPDPLAALPRAEECP